MKKCMKNYNSQQALLGVLSLFLLYGNLIVSAKSHKNQIFTSDPSSFWIIIFHFAVSFFFKIILNVLKGFKDWKKSKTKTLQAGVSKSFLFTETDQLKNIFRL